MRNGPKGNHFTDQVLEEFQSKNIVYLGLVIWYSLWAAMSLSKHDGHVDNGGWEWGGIAHKYLSNR